MYSDIEKIQAGIGDKVVLFLQGLSAFISGFVIGYIVNWKLALVVSVMLPILTVMSAIIAKVLNYFKEFPDSTETINSLPHRLLHPSPFESKEPMQLLVEWLRRCSLPLEQWWCLEESRKRQRGNNPRTIVGNKDGMV